MWIYLWTLYSVPLIYLFNFRLIPISEIVIFISLEISMSFATLTFSKVVLDYSTSFTFTHGFEDQNDNFTRKSAGLLIKVASFCTSKINIIFSLRTIHCCFLFTQISPWLIPLHHSDFSSKVISSEIIFSHYSI